MAPGSPAPPSTTGKLNVPKRKPSGILPIISLLSQEPQKTIAVCPKKNSSCASVWLMPRAPGWKYSCLRRALNKPERRLVFGVGKTARHQLLLLVEARPASEVIIGVVGHAADIAWIPPPERPTAKLLLRGICSQRAKNSSQVRGGTQPCSSNMFLLYQTA